MQLPPNHEQTLERKPSTIIYLDSTMSITNGPTLFVFKWPIMTTTHRLIHISLLLSILKYSPNMWCLPCFSISSSCCLPTCPIIPLAHAYYELPNCCWFWSHRWLQQGQKMTTMMMFTPPSVLRPPKTPANLCLFKTSFVTILLPFYASLPLVASYLLCHIPRWSFPSSCLLFTMPLIINRIRRGDISPIVQFYLCFILTVHHYVHANVKSMAPLWTIASTWHALSSEF